MGQICVVVRSGSMTPLTIREYVPYNIRLCRRRHVVRLGSGIIAERNLPSSRVGWRWRTDWSRLCSTRRYRSAEYVFRRSIGLHILRLCLTHQVLPTAHSRTHTHTHAQSTVYLPTSLPSAQRLGSSLLMSAAASSARRRYGSELILTAQSDGRDDQGGPAGTSLSFKATRPNGSASNSCYCVEDLGLRKEERREAEVGDDGGAASRPARSASSSYTASYPSSSGKDSEVADELAYKSGSLSLSSAPEEVNTARDGEHYSQDSCSFNPFSLSRKPSDFHDEYLIPTMTWNERERIRRYQHVTRGLRDDPQLQKYLADIVALVKDVFSDYEVVIIGLVDVDVFTAKVTEGVAQSSMARQEVSASWFTTAQ